MDDFKAIEGLGDRQQHSKLTSTGEPRPQIGLIGVGLLGNAICDRLMNHGYRLKVWSRYRSEAESVLARGAVWSDNPLADCSRVILCLYSSQVVAEVLGSLGDGMRPGQTIIDMTTGSPGDVVRLAQELSSRHINYLEAPVSGSSDQARTGDAMIIVGGAPEAFEKNRDLWKVLARSVHYTGTSGSASRMKLVTNLVLGLNRAALAEGLSYARSMGIDPEAALQTLRDSAAASRVMEAKGAKMIHEDFSVQARLSQHLKDVRIILQTAHDSGLNLPLSETHQRLLETAEKSGWGELDNSAIIRVYDMKTNRARE